MIQDKKRIGLFIVILFIYSSFFFGSYVWHIIHSNFLSKHEIVATSTALSLNETDALVIMNKIANWLKQNVEWDTTQFRFFPFYWRNEHPSPNWVMSVRCGACEENAILFAELARNTVLKLELFSILVKTMSGMKFGSIGRGNISMLHYQKKIGLTILGSMSGLEMEEVGGNSFPMFILLI